MMRTLYILSLLIVLVGCTRENEKALLDDAATYDPRITSGNILFAGNYGGLNDVYEYVPSTGAISNISNSAQRDEMFVSVNHDMSHVAYISAGNVFTNTLDFTDEANVSSNGAFSTSLFHAGNVNWSSKSDYLVINDLDKGQFYYLNSGAGNGSEHFLADFSTPTNDLVAYPCFNWRTNLLCYVHRTIVGSDTTYTLETSGPNGYGENQSPSILYSSTKEMNSPRFAYSDEVILFIHEGEVCTINADGTAYEQLTNTINTCSSAMFSPDDTQIVYSSTSTGDADLYIMKADGSDALNITKTTGRNEINPFWY